MSQTTVAAYNSAPASTIAVSLVESFKLSAMVSGFVKADTFVRNFASVVGTTGANTLASKTGYQAVRSSTCHMRSGLSQGQSKVREYYADGRVLNHAADVGYHVRVLQNLPHEKDGNVSSLTGDAYNPMIRHPMCVRIVLPLGTDLGSVVRANQIVDQRPPREKIERHPLEQLGDALEAQPEPVDDTYCGLINRSANTCSESCSEFAHTVAHAARTAYLSAVGFSDIIVLDVAYDATLFSLIHETASNGLISTGEKKAPSYYVSKVVHAINHHVKVRKEADPTMSYTKEHHDYMLTVGKLLAVGFILSLGNHMADIVTVTLHCKDVPSPGEYAKAPDLDAITKATQSFAECFDNIDMDTVVPAIPATEISGSPYEDVAVWHDEESLESWVGRQGIDKEQGLGAVVTGANLFACQPPVDTKHPVSYASGMSRHMFGTSVDLPVSAEQVYKAVVDKSQMKKPAAVYYRVAHDVTKGLGKKLALYLNDHDNPMSKVNEKKPTSMAQTDYEEYLAEYWSVAKEGKPNGRDAITVGVFLKAGENSSRGRFISKPGNLGSEDIHQAMTASGVKTVEDFLKTVNNHTHFKGLGIDGFKQDIGEFLEGVKEGQFVFSYDKKANDRTWNSYHYEAFIEFILHLLDVMAENASLGSNYSLSDACFWNHESSSFDIEGKTPYFSFACNFFYYYLLSAVGPTSSCNRWQSTIEIGVITYVIHGEVAYFRWLEAYLNGAPSDHCYDEQFRSHELDYVPKLKWDSTCNSPVIFKNEGDDQVQVHSPTKQLDTWEKMNQKIVSTANQTLGLLLEVVLFDDPGKSCVGSKAVIEICSRGFANRKDDYSPKTAMMVPKPVKNCDKMAWMMTTQASFVRNKDGLMATVQNEVYWQLVCTRALAIAEYNVESPFVGHYVLAHAARALKNLPLGALTLFDKRSMEARLVEDAELSHRVNIRLHDWYYEMEHRVQTHDFVGDQGLMYLASIMWKLENRTLSLTPTMKMSERLAYLDLQMSQVIEIPEEWVTDPRECVSTLNLSVLHPLIEARFRKFADRIAEIRELQPEHLTYENMLARMKKVVGDKGKRIKASPQEIATEGQPCTNGTRDMLRLRNPVDDCESLDTADFIDGCIAAGIVGPAPPPGLAGNKLAGASSKRRNGENGMSPVTHLDSKARPCATPAPEAAEHTAVPPSANLWRAKARDSGR